MCWKNRSEDENRLDGSCSSRWELAAAAALMAGHRGGGDDTMTAAFFVLLREPGSGCRMNGGISTLKGANVPILQYRTSSPHKRRGGEGPESHLGLLSFTALTEKKFAHNLSHCCCFALLSLFSLSLAILLIPLKTLHLLR